MSDKSGVSEQIISTPKGGGALSGIGEKFSPDLHSGTGNFSVPITLPKGRNGFQPDLQLAYSTGNGNSEFGLGWTISTPNISRKTSGGIPLYGATFYKGRDDIFILSGSEDLVAVEKQDDYTRFQPRTEGLFAKIYRHQSANNDYWEVKTKDGLSNYYGVPGGSGNDTSVIANPENSRQVFSWKLSLTRDVFGNRIEYEYIRHTNEPGDQYQWCHNYLKEIRYVDYEENGATHFLVKVKFIYDQSRPDTFSTYKSGFEIRTAYRCSAIEIYTHPDPAAGEILTRRYQLIYQDSLPINKASLLSRIKSVGYNPAGESEELPPLDFEYTIFDPLKRKFERVTGLDLPSKSLGSANYELADLTGNGLPDIMEMNGSIRFWKNLGNGKFDSPVFMAEGPGGLQLSDPNVQLIDANGDGQIDLMVNNNTTSGYYSLQQQGMWNRKSFQSYKSAPGFSLEDAEVKLVDIDGDGITDILRSGTKMECYFNHKYNGWEQARWIERKPIREFPDINFSDSRVKWGDMSGDGMQDIVLVYDGNIAYWPNTGYGSWGRQKHMQNCPRFPFGYDPRRILLGDIDGDGLADILYVGDRNITIWINQSGNSWSDPLSIQGTPPVTDPDAVRLVDLLGTGVSGVLWSADARSDLRPHLYFLDFTGGVKPCLLCTMKNNMGAETHVDYTSSTHYYLEDEKRLSTRWKTSLPFPVQVVARVEVTDHFSKGKLVTLYDYHHGYWDGAEREFLGFGRVEQKDTEAFDIYHQADLTRDPFAPVDEMYFAPPTLSKTWFHQGAVGDEYGGWNPLDYNAEYWNGDKNLLDRADWKPFPTGLSRRTRRDALRSLRGKTLRTELYALDGSIVQDRPYTITESIYGIREENTHSEIIPPGNMGKPIFFPFITANRVTQWERGNDPMYSFSFSGEYDEVGQLLQQTQVACPRTWRNTNEQVNYVATRTRFQYAVPQTTDIYIRDRVARILNFEILNPQLENLVTLAGKSDNLLTMKIAGCSINFYDETNGFTPAFGELTKYGALTRSESLVLTPDLIEEIYSDGANRFVPPYFDTDGTTNWTNDYPLAFRNELTQLAGYIYKTGGSEYEEGFYNISTNKKYDFYNGKGNGLIIEQKDPLGHRTSIDYDRYKLFPVKLTNSKDLITSALYDYIHMQASKITDANGNESLFTFTPLGLMRESWLKGDPRKTEGDRTDPSIKMEYGLLSFVNSDPTDRQPVFVRAIQRIHHDTETEFPAGELDGIMTKIEYSDGFGRVLQTRMQAEDIHFGNTAFGDAGLPVSQLQNAPAIGHTAAPGEEEKVVVSGWQIYNNKGNTVEKFEPFFDQGWDFILPGQNQSGEKATMYYDARGQVIKTLNPDASVQQVIHGIPHDLDSPPLSPNDIEKFDPTPWEAYTYDVNDNAGRTHGNDLLALGYKHHWNTPGSIEVNAIGKVIRSVTRLRDKPVDITDPLPPVRELSFLSAYDAHGNLVEVTDAKGRKAFVYRYDLAKHPVKLISIDSGARFNVFDAASGLIESRDSNGAITLQTNDVLLRPKRKWARDDANSPIALKQEIIYGDELPLAAEFAGKNLLGNPAFHYDEAGLQRFEEYDFKGNVLKKTRQLISNAMLLSVYNTTNWNIKPFHVDWTGGVQPPLENSGFSTFITYDALNRVKQIECPEDTDGNRKKINPSYNRAGDLQKLTVDNSIYVEHIAYNAKGQRLLIVYGNNLMTRYAYDSKTFRLTRLRTERYNNPLPYTYNPAGGTTQDYAYQYDLIGNMLTVNEKLPGCGVNGSQSGNDELNRLFEYDSLYRLILATGRCGATADLSNGWQDGQQPGFNSWNHGTPNQDNAPDLTALYREKYIYDEGDNLVMLSRQSGQATTSRVFTTTGINNRLVSVATGANTSNTYSYDMNGNMQTENSEREFQWNNENRLKAFIVQTGNAEPTIHAQYFYNDNGDRIKKIVRKQGGNIQVSIYIDGLFEHHESIKQGVSSSNNLIHIMDDQSRIALIRVGDPLDPNDTSPVVQFHLGDHLGSSHVVVNDDGTLLNREEYFPFGETSFGSFRYKRYRYTGRERDEESGLSNHRARYYAPWLARWMSCDPMGIIDGPNLYTYTTNNPVKLIDPEGTDGKDPPVNQVSMPQLKQWDESKQNTFDRNRKNAGAEQAFKNFMGASPRQKMEADAATASLKQNAERESIRLATPWQEQVIYDVSEYTGGNDMARSWTGASEWNEGYTGWERVGFGVKGVLTAASYATPVAELAEGMQTVRVGLFSRVPVQLRGPSIGPAFRTIEEASGHGNHYLQVIVRDRNSTVIAEWFEASQTGLGKLGHTEQKALMRMNLKPGQEVTFIGEFQPCNVTGGCHMTMSSVAKQTGADIIYFSPGARNPGRFYQGSVGHIPSTK